MLVKNYQLYGTVLGKERCWGEALLSWNPESRVGWLRFLRVWPL